MEHENDHDTELRPLVNTRVSIALFACQNFFVSGILQQSDTSGYPHYMVRFNGDNGSYAQIGIDTRYISSVNGQHIVLSEFPRNPIA